MKACLGSKKTFPIKYLVDLSRGLFTLFQMKQGFKINSVDDFAKALEDIMDRHSS
jgi:hypothetical protein